MNKQRFITGAGYASFGIDVGLEFHKTIDFDKKKLRGALTKGGADVRKEARRLLARRAVSAPGEVPGEVTGRLKRAIGVVSRGTGGGWVKIAPRTIKGSAFYPAFLFYGSKKNNLQKRANYMVQALKTRAPAIRASVRDVLRNSLVPR